MIEISKKEDPFYAMWQVDVWKQLFDVWRHTSFGISPYEIIIKEGFRGFLKNVFRQYKIAKNEHKLEYQNKNET